MLCVFIVAVKMQAFGKSNVLLAAMPSLLYTQDAPEASAKHLELYSTEEQKGRIMVTATGVIRVC